MILDEYGLWDEEAEKVLQEYLEANPDLKDKFPVLETQQGKNLFYEIYKRTKASSSSPNNSSRGKS